LKERDMTKQPASIPSFPDMQALFGISPGSLEYAEWAYRTWCATAGDIQSHAREFLNARLAKDTAAMAEFAQCKTPIEMFSAQMQYANKAFADLVEEGQKVVAYLGNMATGAMLPGPMSAPYSAPQSDEGGESKRSPHRRASRSH
jgi:hypothetical protein